MIRRLESKKESRVELQAHAEGHTTLLLLLTDVEGFGALRAELCRGALRHARLAMVRHVGLARNLIRQA